MHRRPRAIGKATPLARPKSDAVSLADWARSMEGTPRAFGCPNRLDVELGSIAPIEHPALLIQAALREVFRPTTPTEVYSDEQPVFIQPPPQKDSWIPIDVLLGNYDPKTRTIRIFYKNIQHFAETTFSCPISDLETIVRLHEYAHALVHLGVFVREESAVISVHPPAEETDWKAFLRARSRAFRSLRSDAQEFLAQVLCWSAIGLFEPLVARSRLQDLFLVVMDHQPPEYRLSPDVVGKALYGDPTAMLSWARNMPRARPTRHTPDLDIAQALLRTTLP
jgi:hypothetical protein